MDASSSRYRSRYRLLLPALAVGCLCLAAGCSVLATAMWIATDGETHPAEYRGLRNKRVAVVARGPQQIQFRPEVQAPQQIAIQVGRRLKEKIRKIDVIESMRVAQAADEQEWSDFVEIGRAVDAELVVGIDIESYRFNQARSIHSATASATVTVYDMALDGEEVYRGTLHSLEFPPNIGGIPVTDMSEQQFQELFVRYVSEQIGRKFYDHDPRSDYAGFGWSQ